MIIEFILILLLTVLTIGLIFGLIALQIFVIKEGVEIAILRTINKKYLIEESKYLGTQETPK